MDRELVLMRVKADSKTRAEVMQICDIFRAKIIDVQPERPPSRSPARRARSTNSSSSWSAFGIIDITRTGKVALSRTND